MSNGHFGISVEMSRVRSVLGTKCPYTVPRISQNVVYWYACIIKKDYDDIARFLRHWQSAWGKDTYRLIFKG